MRWLSGYSGKATSGNAVSATSALQPITGETRSLKTAAEWYTFIGLCSALTVF